MSAIAVRPSTLLEVSRRAVAGTQRFDPALREFLDEFYSHPDRQQSAILDEPVLVEDIKDAYLAAVAEYLAMRHHLDVPTWTEDHGRPLRKAFFSGGLESLKAVLTVESPAPFRRRLLFISRNALDRPNRQAEPDLEMSEPHTSRSPGTPACP